MKKRIFIDLDGVIADWEKSSLDCLKINRDEIYPQLKDGAKLESIFPDIYQKIQSNGLDFWLGLDKLPWADELVEKTSNYGDVAFLSSGGNPYGRTAGVGLANHGKTLWVAQNFQNIPLILTREKYLCASENALLIDDTTSKVDKFIDYGGSGFIWPQPYSLIKEEIDVNDVLNKLETQIKNW